MLGQSLGQSVATVVLCYYMYAAACWAICATLMRAAIIVTASGVVSQQPILSWHLSRCPGMF